MSATKVVLDRLVRFAPPVIGQITKPGPHCVLSCTVGQMVLARMGIVAEPYPVEISVANKAWMDWTEAGNPGGHEEQLRRGAYLITNHPNWNGASFQTVTVDHPWDGHLVLRVLDAPEMWLVDLDLGAFNRPLRQIAVPPAVVAPLRDDGKVAGVFSDDQIDTSICYQPLVAPYAHDYQTARDWVERDRFKPEVDALVHSLTLSSRRKRGGPK